MNYKCDYIIFITACLKQLYRQRAWNSFSIKEVDESHYCPKCRAIEEQIFQNVGRPQGLRTQMRFVRLKRHRSQMRFVRSKKRLNESETDSNKIFIIPRVPLEFYP